MDLSIKQFLALGLIPQITTAMWKKIGANAHFLCLYFGVFAGGIA